MKKIVRRNAFYTQSGGVSAVINASACGVIETAMRCRQIGKLYAGRHGIIGALTEDLIDVGRESAATIRALKHTPAGAFGSARFKLKGIEQNRTEYERLIEGYVPQPYPERVDVLLSSNPFGESPDDREFWWRKVVKNIRIHYIPGQHATFTSKNLPTLAQHITDALTK